MKAFVSAFMSASLGFEVQLANMGSHPFAEWDLFSQCFQIIIWLMFLVFTVHFLIKETK